MDINNSLINDKLRVRTILGSPDECMLGNLRHWAREGVSNGVYIGYSYATCLLEFWDNALCIGITRRAALLRRMKTLYTGSVIDFIFEHIDDNGFLLDWPDADKAKMILSMDSLRLRDLFACQGCYLRQVFPSSAAHSWGTFVTSGVYRKVHNSIVILDDVEKDCLGHEYMREFFAALISTPSRSSWITSQLKKLCQ